MKTIHNLVQFCRRDDGVTSVEYGVMLAFILLAVIIGITATGGGAAGWWGTIDSDLDSHGF